MAGWPEALFGRRSDAFRPRGGVARTVGRPVKWVCERHSRRCVTGKFACVNLEIEGAVEEGGLLRIVPEIVGGAEDVHASKIQYARALGCAGQGGGGMPRQECRSAGVC